MSDSSVMMSESLIDRVDMTKFYDLMPTSTLFLCKISFENESSDVNIAGFKRHLNKIEISLLCSQEITSRLILNDKIDTLNIFYGDDEIFKLDQGSLYDMGVDIGCIQDSLCKVRLFITS